MTILRTIERKTKDTIKNFIAKFGYQISRRNTVFVSDKIVERKIGKFRILMREDHQLPIFLKYLPHYSKNLPRLATQLFKKYSNLSMIDVGANIGDTVALVRSEGIFPIFCIEGDIQFFELLKKNINQFKGVQAFRYLLGETNGVIKAELKKNVETARLHESVTENSSNLVNITTLDLVISEYPDMGKAKLLKIDTDGYDMKILRGGLEYIKYTKPVIFLEYDQIFFYELKDSGIRTLELLEQLGYDDIIFYDNLGNFILSTNLSNHLILKQLNNYIDPKLRVPFPYYDIAVFHKEDKDIAEDFIKKEMAYFYSDKYYAK